MTKRQAQSKQKSPSKRAQTVRQIRDILGRTQVELANALGVSAKAVQSYEQGWRDVPVRTMIQLLVLLALYRRQSMHDVPCWEILNCSPDHRDTCPSFTVGKGQFCWFIGDKSCAPDGATEDDLIPCMRCPVIQRLLKGTETNPARKGAT